MRLDAAWESEYAAVPRVGWALPGVFVAGRVRLAVPVPGRLHPVSVVAAVEAQGPEEQPGQVAAAWAERDTWLEVVGVRAVDLASGILAAVGGQAVPDKERPAEVAVSVTAGAYLPDSRVQVPAAVAPGSLGEAELVRLAAEVAA